MGMSDTTHDKILAWIDEAEARGIRLQQVAKEKGCSTAYVPMALRRNINLHDIAVARGVYVPLSSTPKRTIEAEFTSDTPKKPSAPPPAPSPEEPLPRFEQCDINGTTLRILIADKARRDEAIKHIVQLLEQGERLDVCSACAGVSKQTLAKWMQDDYEIAIKFAQAYAKYRVWAATMLRKAITNAAEKGHVKQIVEALGRKFPSEYGEVKHVDIKVKNESAHSQTGVDLESVSDEDLLAMINKLAKAKV